MKIKYAEAELQTDLPMKCKIKLKFKNPEDPEDEMNNCPYKDLGRRMINVDQGKKGFLDTCLYKILYDKAAWEMRSSLERM